MIVNNARTYMHIYLGVHDSSKSSLVSIFLLPRVQRAQKSRLAAASLWLHGYCSFLASVTMY
jgi:hypothetical protein